MATSKILRIGDIAPDFHCASTSSEDFHFHKYIEGSWTLFVSHPADYTPICTTELGSLQKTLPDLDKRGVKVVGLSVDSVANHKGFVNDINETQCVDLTFPIVADEKREVAVAYGMLDQTSAEKITGLPLTVRSVFVIDPSKKIRLIISYPASCGRNFTEVLRVIDSLQLTDSKKVFTPANWKKGDDVVVPPSISNEKAHEMFGDLKTVKPYLRYVTQEQVDNSKQ